MKLIESPYNSDGYLSHKESIETIFSLWKSPLDWMSFEEY